MQTTTQPLAVTPFTVAIDTREQSPYGFFNLPFGGDGRRLVVERKVITLSAGDYSICKPDMTGRIAIERKSLPDLFGTLGKGRERFCRELERFREYDYAAVVIEADWKEICNPFSSRANWRAKMSPRSVFGTLLAWTQAHVTEKSRYPYVHWFTAGNRRMAEVITFGLLERFYWDHK